MTENLIVLGSTGSVGRQTLEVSRNLDLNIFALCAKSNINLLEEQIRLFKPQYSAVLDENAAKILKNNVKDLPVKIFCGIDGICELSELKGADIVLNAIGGMAGLKPTLAALNAKKTVAIANKETLVAGGGLVTETAKRNGVQLLPVDSEHSAIFQCIHNKNNKFKKIILTASGGPFFGKTKAELKNVTLEETLKHPTYEMGKKISVDSATLMNKGLEIIEAFWLFDVKNLDDIKIVVHRESIVHSMVEFEDNSIIAQMSVPDMRLPIQFALTYPKRCASCTNSLDLTKYKCLTFHEPDYKTFESLDICKNAIKVGESLPIAVNAANEEAVDLFLNKKITFLEIIELIKHIVKNHKLTKIKKLDDILKIDKATREQIKELTL